MKYYVCLVFLSIMLFCTPALRADSPFQLDRTDTSMMTYDIAVSVNKNCKIQPFKSDVPISGLSIDGSIEKSEPDYLVRIILLDKNGGEHLVLESYEELNSSVSFSFANYCEETTLLNNICPVELKLIVKGAKLTIKSLHIASQMEKLDEKLFNKRKSEIRIKQVNNIIDRINNYNKENSRLWLAGRTAIALCNYEKRRTMLGLADEVNSCGIEYYIGGIFEFGHMAEIQKINTYSPYVDNFDWRNRHGKNWISPFDNQEESAFCTVFAALGSLEAVANLYYNRLLNVNLSEREITDCADIMPHQNNDGMHDTLVYNYLRNHGVCDAVAYPNGDLNNEILFLSCKSDSIIPNEQIRISNYYRGNENINDIKRELISKGPLLSGWGTPYFSGNYGHAMTLVGYKRIEANDTIWYYNSNTNSTALIGVINENDPRVGATYWIFKNSYGENSGHVAYYNLIFSKNSSASDITIPSMIAPLSIGLPLMSQNLTNDSIVWEDADGDGYYYWGIGPRPYSCSGWIPDIPDGDDSDPTKGPIDSYGYFYDVDGHGDYSISGNNHILDGVQTLYGGIVIGNNSTLQITGSISLVGTNKIVIKQGGKLIVNAGRLINAEFVFNPPCTVKIINDGAIFMKASCDFDPPLGCVIEIDRGKIGNMRQINWYSCCQTPLFY